MGYRVGSAEELDLGRLGSQRRKSRLAHKTEGAGRQHRYDMGAGIDKAPAQFDGLVGGNAATYTENDCGTLQRCQKRRVSRPGMAHGRGPRPGRLALAGLSRLGSRGDLLAGLGLLGDDVFYGP